MYYSQSMLSSALSTGW